MSDCFLERSDVLRREWLSQDGCFRQCGDAEDSFWRFAIAIIQDGAGAGLSIVEVDRLVRRASSNSRGAGGTDGVSILGLASQIESVYCFLDAQRGVAHQKEHLS